MNKTIDLNNLSVNQIKLLNNISQDIIHDYNYFVEKIYEETDGSIFWVVNSVLSRNNYLSKSNNKICIAPPYIKTVSGYYGFSNNKDIKADWWKEI